MAESLSPGSEPQGSSPSRDLGPALQSLRDRLTSTSLAIDLDGTPDARIERDALVAQIDDYLLPRVKRLDAPLLLVIGGSTGAGKSTLTNTLVGEDVSQPGVLRPTTRSPVLVCHPDDRIWFEGTEVLPDLARVTGADPGTTDAVRLEATTALSPGLAILDTPDIDSVEAANRTLAAQLLSAADLWLFVTTAARYADAVPWDHLRQAQERSTALAVVLNRVPAEAKTEVSEHLRTMLDDAGLERSDLFTMAETTLTDQARIPDSEVAPLQAWLNVLAADAEQRARLVRQTLDGALESLVPRVENVASHIDQQQRAGDELANAVDLAFTEAKRGVTDGLVSGAMLRSEVLERWQELIGGNEIMKSIQTSIGRARDLMKSFVTGKETADDEARGAIESNVEMLLETQAEAAALRVVQLWRATPGGAAALGEDRAVLEHASPGFNERAGREVRDWQGEIIDLVRDEGAGKRVLARTLTLGVNSVGVALMILVFANTGGLTGGEVAIAGGTAGVSQTLLTAIFGDQAVRSLAAEARRKLLDRVDTLFEAEAERFKSRLAPIVPDLEGSDDLRQLVAAVDDARLVEPELKAAQKESGH